MVCPSQLVCVAELTGHEDRVWHAAWNPQKPLLATCSADKTVRLYSYTRSGETIQFDHIHTLPTGHSKTIRALAWSPGGHTLACGSFDSTISIWEQESKDDEWECVATLEGPESEIKSLAYSPGGNLLATCSRDKSVWIWEVLPDHEHETVSVLMGQHAHDVKCVNWHPTEEILASGSYDDLIKLYADDPADDWYDFTTLKGHTSTVWSVTFSPSGRFLASASDDLTIRLWTFGNDKGSQGDWQCVHVLRGHTRSVYSLTWGPGINSNDCVGWLASTGSDGTINVWSIWLPDSEGSIFPGSTLTASLTQGHGFYDINAVSFCPRSGFEDLLVSVGDDSLAKIWKIVSNPSN